MIGILSPGSKNVCSKVHIKYQDEAVYVKLSGLYCMQQLQIADWFGFQTKMTHTPVRAVQLDIPTSEAYSLESVGKHGFGKFLHLPTDEIVSESPNWLKCYLLNLLLLFSAAIEVGPQPNGVIRADVYNTVKEAVDLTIEWLQGFNSGKKKPQKKPKNCVSTHPHGDWGLCLFC